MKYVEYTCRALSNDFKHAVRSSYAVVLVNTWDVDWASEILYEERALNCGHAVARQGRTILPKRTAAPAGCVEVPEREVTYICVYSERDAAEETVSRIFLYLTATCLQACNKLILHSPSAWDCGLDTVIKARQEFKLLLRIFIIATVWYFLDLCCRDFQSLQANSWMLQWIRRWQLLYAY